MDQKGNALVEDAYCELCRRWGQASPDERAQLLDRFKVGFSFNSGSIENPEITYHDTAEVFDKNGVSNFTGDVRTIYEINNLKNAWAWLMDAVASKTPLGVEALLDSHRILTAGTYDEARWENGERPGTFKRGDYRVANDVGLPPDAVEEAVASLLDELREAMAAGSARRNALTIAAYGHGRLVDIHPFADGNGRTARLLMNYILLMLDQPPCTIDADDRMAYFGALDGFHEDGDLSLLRLFLMVQTLKTWDGAALR